MEKQQDEESQKLAKNSLAGTAGGMTSVVVGQPFDIVKIRMQSQAAANPLYSSPAH